MSLITRWKRYYAYGDLFYILKAYSTYTEIFFMNKCFHGFFQEKRELTPMLWHIFLFLIPFLYDTVSICHFVHLAPSSSEGMEVELKHRALVLFINKIIYSAQQYPQCIQHLFFSYFITKFRIKVRLMQNTWYYCTKLIYPITSKVFISLHYSLSLLSNSLFPPMFPTKLW